MIFFLHLNMSHRSTVRVTDGKLSDIVVRNPTIREVKVTVVPNDKYYRGDYYKEIDVKTNKKLKFTPESLVYMLPSKAYPNGCFRDFDHGEWFTVEPDSEGHAMVRQHLWDGNPLPDKKYPVHLPSIELAIKYAVEREKLERLLSGDEQPPKRGRPKLYADDDEKKRKHREQALRSYYRRKALKEHLDDPADGDEVHITIDTSSKTLGDISEEVTFRRTNGNYRKRN